jgi:hypothetical protein
MVAVRKMVGYDSTSKGRKVKRPTKQQTARRKVVKLKQGAHDLDKTMKESATKKRGATSVKSYTSTASSPNTKAVNKGSSTSTANKARAKATKAKLRSAVKASKPGAAKAAKSAARKAGAKAVGGRVLSALGGGPATAALTAGMVTKGFVDSENKKYEKLIRGGAKTPRNTARKGQMTRRKK